MSKYNLAFAESVKYPSHKQGIDLGIILKNGEKRVSLEAKLDTGSTFCIFQRQFAELLGFEIETGDVELIRTATGKFIAYGHEAIIGIANLEWEATVYFAQDEYFPVNVLGRAGFLDRLQIGLIDYEQLLFIDSLENYYT
jgi:hypothetical protein